MKICGEEIQLNTVFLGCVNSKRRLVSRDMNKRYPDAQIGNFVINSVPVKIKDKKSNKYILNGYKNYCFTKISEYWDWYLIQSEVNGDLYTYKPGRV